MNDKNGRTRRRQTDRIRAVLQPRPVTPWPPWAFTQARRHHMRRPTYGLGRTW